jgi:hypothetical protein
MAKNDDITRYSAGELAAMRDRGDSRTDWAMFKATIIPSTNLLFALPSRCKKAVRAR